MKSKKIVRTTALLVVFLSLITYWLLKKDTHGTLSSRLYDFALSDTAEISTIILTHPKGNKITLSKNSSNEWQVNKKFVARAEAVNNLLSCIKNIEMKQPVSKLEADSIGKHLPLTGTKVELWAEEELLKSYYVGGDAEDNRGTYMLLIHPESGAPSSTPFIMCIPGFSGVLSVRYIAQEDFWRNKTVYAFYPDQISSIHVEHCQTPDSSFTLHLSDKHTLALTDANNQPIAKLDTLKAQRYITYFTNLPYESMPTTLPAKSMDSILHTSPAYAITLSDRQGKNHTLKAYYKPAEKGQTDPVSGKRLTVDLERMYARINQDNNWVVIQYYIFGKIFQPVNYFLPDNARLNVKK
jgi:hypothetical protein